HPGRRAKEQRRDLILEDRQRRAVPQQERQARERANSVLTGLGGQPEPERRDPTQVNQAEHTEIGIQVNEEVVRWIEETGGIETLRAADTAEPNTKGKHVVIGDP